MSKKVFAINNYGLSLVEVLVAASILIIISTAIGSLIISMQQRMTFVEKKSDSIGLKNELMTLFSNDTNCTCLLNTTFTGHIADNSIDPYLNFDSSITDGSQSFPVKKIRSGCGISSFVLYENGKVLPSNLQIDTITMADLKPTGAPKQWHGNWKINFTPSSSSVPLKPITIPQVFTIDDTTLNNSKIVSCGSLKICSPQQALEAGVCVDKCNTFQYWDDTTSSCIDVWKYRIAWECGSDHFTTCQVCGVDKGACRLCDSDGTCNNYLAIMNVCKNLHPHNYSCP